jgi:glycosyltransferase involved in cell wall biosynthesis
MYNICDCTINIADAEGFGLATLESLACEVPIIVNMTGGLQEQVTNGEDWFGVGIHPSSRSVIGSQSVPYIYEDRISKDHFIKALEHMINLEPSDLKKLGQKGRQHVLDNYGFDKFNETWVKEMINIHETCGSWETRKNYSSWECKEIL